VVEREAEAVAKAKERGAAAAPPGERPPQPPHPAAQVADLEAGAVAPTRVRAAQTPTQAAHPQSGQRTRPEMTNGKPKLVWPAATAIYPWTSSIGVSVQTNLVNPKDAFMCPQYQDTSKLDEVNKNCVPWYPQTIGLAEATLRSEKAEHVRRPIWRD
jgi:hypothetical protein